MNQEEQSEPNGPESSDQTEKNKSNAIINASLIGFMIGVIAWSIAKSTVGLFTLIPLYIIYRLVNQPKA